MQMTAMLLFAFCFFDAEEVLFSGNDHSDSGDNKHINELQTSVHFSHLKTHCDGHNSNAVFDKIVLIVIDALRADFVPSIVNNSVLNYSLPFTESVLKTNG